MMKSLSYKHTLYRCVVFFVGLLLVLTACRNVAPAAPENSPVLESQITLPSQFADQWLATINQPTALAFTPGGRLLITEKPGRLRLYNWSSLQDAPALDISSKVCTESERGLLGVAVDNNFAQNGFIYLFYSYNKPGTNCGGYTTNIAVNRVSRFFLGSNSTIDPNSEVVLIDNIPAYGNNHNGGDLFFGKDGYLYASVGDGGCDYAKNSGCAGDNNAAQDPNVLVGKIIRITRDGGIPPSNPFLGANSARCNTGTAAVGKVCQEIFATGLRNPFRMAADPNAATTRFFINDVGQDTWEEINLGQAGANYGWNTREGNCVNGSSSNCGTVAGLTNPVYTYQHTTGCASITGGAFVPNGFWPTSYDNGYMFADYVCGKIFLLKGSTATEFATGLGNSSAVHMIFGPYGSGRALYYTTFAGGGQVRRIAYTGTTNRSPVASFTVTPNSGSVPLTVTVNASASSDPDGDALTYSWNFGDGTTGSGVTTQKTYNSAGKFIIVLTVRDSKGATSTFSKAVFPGNTAPSLSITSPSTTARFSVGQTITVQGTATDAQDGVLPATSLRWTVYIRHNTHTHPYATGTGNSITLTMPAPEDVAAVDNSWLEVNFIATDSQGLTSYGFQRLLPSIVYMNFATSPTGRTFTVNGVTYTAPKTVKSWPNYNLNVNAPNQGTYIFQSWSDGGAQSHTIKTPAANSNFTATFRTQ